MKDSVCVKGAEGKDLSIEVDRIMQITELATPGCKYVGLVRRAVLIVFWNCNEVASQSAKGKPKWTEALQSDVERLAVQISSFQ